MSIGVDAGSRWWFRDGQPEFSIPGPADTNHSGMYPDAPKVEDLKAKEGAERFNSDLMAIADDLWRPLSNRKLDLCVPKRRVSLTGSEIPATRKFSP